jgi:hypothetical protein
MLCLKRSGDECSFLLVCEGSEFRVKNREATAHHQAAAQAEPGQKNSVADPDFYPSRIPDLGSRIQLQHKAINT